tara:strand:+ start:1809 stop:2486 length:678 start_codon:yes stop_codon:yes gene_type:complete
MHDIALYGHLTVDRIFDGFEERQTLGAMANMWRTFKLIAPDLDIGLAPTSIGEAMVYIDRDSSTRYSNFVPDIKTNKPIIKESKISHAMYINKLLDISWLKDLKGIISADVCAGPRVDASLLQHVDYFFIADEDAYADLSTMCKDTKGYVILHTNKSSVVSDGTNETKYKIEENMFVEKSNVLGAGDMFASSFLYALNKNMSIEQIQKYAHETTSRLITSANEKV